MSTHELSLAPALTGARFDIETKAGRLSLYDEGSGSPLLLIHSVNAAGSAAEMRPVQRYYAARRRVFCLELPGFGLSERSDRLYSPRLMTDAVLAAAAEIAVRTGEAAIDALALSLGCEFLGRAAVEQSARFRRLAFVSPTGLSARGEWRAATGTTRGKPWLYRTLRGPSSLPGGGWGKTVYGWLTRPAVIRYFLNRTWGSPQIDEALWQYDVATTRVSGAAFAPLYFLSGELFSADIHSIYEKLTQPLFVAHGIRGDFTDYRRVDLLVKRAHTRLRVYQTGALPYFEESAKFCADFDAFLAEEVNLPARD